MKHTFSAHLCTRGGDSRWRLIATVDGQQYETDYESYAEAVFNLAKWNREFGETQETRKTEPLNKGDWPPVRKPPPPPPATQPA
jgi:hypothetical protein